MKTIMRSIFVCLMVGLMSANAMAARGGKGKSGGGSGGGDITGGCAGGVGTGIPVAFSLAATEIGQGQVSLSWWAVTNATTYWVFRDGCTTNNVIAIVTTPYYIDAYAIPGATHTY